MRKSARFSERAAYLYACLLLTVLWLYLPYGGYGRMMEGKYACFLLLTTAYLAAESYAARSLGARLAGKLRVMDAAAAAYLGSSALSALLSPYGVHTILGGTRRDGLLTLALYVVCFRLLSRHLHPDRALVDLTALSAAACDVLVLAQLAGFDPLGLYPEGLNYYDGDAAYAGYFAGTSGNIDFTAFLLALAVCVLLVAVVRLRLWALSPVIALTLWTLWRLGVAAAWVGIAFAVVWCPALLAPRHGKRLLILSAALTVAALLLLRRYGGGSGTLAEASRLLRGEFDGSFGSGRLMIWRDCMTLVRERPLLGGGPDTLWLRGIEPFAWAPEGTAIPADITAAHNEYLNILVNQGALALAAYLALLIFALAGCYRRAGEPRCAICGMGLLCYAAMAGFSISTCITAPYVWLLFALCNWYHNIEKRG